MTLLLVMLGGAVGAPVRYAADRAVRRPFGILLVNVLGSVILGALTGAAHALPHWAGALVGTGFCGALTTYSTFGHDAVSLAERGAWGRAAGYVSGTVAAGLLGVWLGAAAARTVLGVTSGRVVFADSPWPDGHPLAELVWSARLEPGPRLFFDLHLRTADLPEDAYDEDEGEEEEEDEADDDRDTWHQPGAWANYSPWILSSTYWGHRGFLAGTPEHPLCPADLTSRLFEADPVPYPPGRVDVDGLHTDAFGGYLIGHDDVAQHRIRFPERHSATEFSLDWQGRIALTYTGGTGFAHTFHVTATRVRLDHIDVSPEADPATLGAVLREADRFTLTGVPAGDRSPYRKDWAQRFVPRT